MLVDSSVHDVCADPLDARWRKKVEAATKVINWEMGHTTTPPPARRPHEFSGENRFVAGRERLFQALWNAGVPKWRLTELGFGTAPSHAAQHLRYRGMWLDIRCTGWCPPADWQRRLDELIDTDG